MTQNGPVAVVTGGTGGLGGAVTAALLQAGWSVLATFADQQSFDDLATNLADHGALLRGFRADLTRADDAQKLAQFARQEFAGVAALINLVGGFSGGRPLIETSEDVWDRMLALNMKTTFLATQSIAPLIVQGGGGAIVNVGSRAGLRLEPGIGAYGVSKAGVIVLTKVLANELRSDRVRVNCVLPSTIDTPANRKSMPGADFSKWVAPERIAELILFLVSGHAEDISGACVPIYGDA